MASIETMIDWMNTRKDGVTYSMSNRGGPNSYDCSSAVYSALIAGGFLPPGTGLGTTETLFSDLPKNGWQKLPNEAPHKRGDIFIWGAKGASDGSSGHTGIFTSSNMKIHCTKNATVNGIAEGPYQRDGRPEHFYRYNGASDAETPSAEVMENGGELELLGIKNGKVLAEGWHYAKGKEKQILYFYDAVNTEKDEDDKDIPILLAKKEATSVERLDLKEKYPDAEGIEKCGFSEEIEVPNGTSVYIKSVRTDGKNPDNDKELFFGDIITLEQTTDIETNNFSAGNEKFFFEIIRNGKIIKRGTKILNDLNWSNELMYVPTTSITLPIEYRSYLSGREEVKLYLNHKVFHGIVTAISENKTEETIEIDLDHIIAEWQFRQISTNLAAKNRTINDIYSTLDFRYDGWNMNYLQDSATREIDYVYSRQNKLDGLTQTCELTEDLFWRVGFRYGRNIDIGTFGEKKPYILSKRPTGGRNIRILSEPTIRHEFENVINMVTVYGEKSDSGMSSMSLRDVFVEQKEHREMENSTEQEKQFPVYISRKKMEWDCDKNVPKIEDIDNPDDQENAPREKVNNERIYNYKEFSKLAPNHAWEYAVFDTESIKREDGTLLEGTFAFNDLSPFSEDGKEITDEDRAKAAQVAYDAAIRKLKLSRRRFIIELDTEELPNDLEVGDKVRFLYDNSLYMMEECSSYMKEILTYDDWFYITSIDYNFDESGAEYNSISLEKDLQIDREVSW